MQTVLVLNEPELNLEILKGIKSLYKGKTLKLTIESDEQQKNVWATQTAEQFLNGYHEKDNIYDRL